MVKKKRFYLDYNATAPLSEFFIQELTSGAVSFCNPSSSHNSGKSALKQVNIVKDYLFDHFGLDSKEYKLIFHSGTTEFANTFFPSFTEYSQIIFKSDHPCILEQSIDQNRLYDLQSDGKYTLSLDPYKNYILNHTWLHNETGVVNELEELENLKSEHNVIVHVDASQVVGKISNYNKLSNMIDAYSFSGNKFGALKGIGFSFVKKSLKLKPLIKGGGQQDNLRSGTLNIHGIYSIFCALKEVESSIVDIDKLSAFKLEIETLFNGNKWNIVENESANTICLIHSETKSDLLLTHFDLAGLDVGTGSACSSGSLSASKTLQSMGHGERSNKLIRISLGMANLADKTEILERLRPLALI